MNWKLFLANYKTTIIGAIGAGFQVVLGVQSGDWKHYAYAFLIGAFGFLAKDYNVSGGTQILASIAKAENITLPTESTNG